MNSPEHAKQVALANVNLGLQNLKRISIVPDTRAVGYVAFDLATNVLSMPPFERMVFVASFTLNFLIASNPISLSPFREVREETQMRLLETVNALKVQQHLYGTIVDSPANAAMSLVEEFFLRKQLSMAAVREEEQQIQLIATMATGSRRAELNMYGDQLLLTLLPKANVDA